MVWSITQTLGMFESSREEKWFDPFLVSEVTGGAWPGGDSEPHGEQVDVTGETWGGLVIIQSMAKISDVAQQNMELDYFS